MNPTDCIFLPPSKWIDVIDSQATDQLLSRPALIDEIERVWGKDVAGDLRWISVDISGRWAWLAIRERIQEQVRENAQDYPANRVLRARHPHHFIIAVFDLFDAIGGSSGN